MVDLNETLSPASIELSDTDVERAQRGECDNPVFSVLERNVGLMRASHPKSHDARDAFADDLIKASPFELDIQTIIATWAIGLKGQQDRFGVAREFSGPLFAVHALYDYKRREATEGITSGFIRTGKLPDAVFLDEGYLNYAKQRIAFIAGEMTRLSVYMDGVPDAMDEVTRLAGSERIEDKQRLKELLDYSKAHKTPILSAVRENVANSIIGLSLSLDR
ncbi:MAG: hypothetical protein ABI220_03575 [Candidatus Saccharimonadales bacterium]